MLAYRIWQELEAGWKEFNLTVKEGLELLKSLVTVNIKLPDTLEKNQSIMHTYKELNRKS